MFKLKFHTDNSAFHDEAGGMPDVYAKYGEVRRILQQVIREIEAGNDHGKCIDYNGNVVGEWEVT